jgi:DNA-binding transcriptional LysR family regulator
MELSHLYYVVTLADCKNFTRAAEKLFITQPTLSQQIKKLESECGFSLFQRNSKHVNLSSEGELFIEKARIILTHFEDLQSMVRGMAKQPSRVIYLGINLASSVLDIAGCAAKLMLEFPHIEFRVIEARSTELTEMVRDGKIDIAFTDLGSSTEWSGLNVSPVSEEYVCLIANKAHHLVGKKSVALEELENETLIYSSHRSVISRLLRHLIEEQGIRPCSTMEFNSPDARASFVSKGTGVAFAPSIRAEWYRNHQLEVIPIEPRIHLTFALISAEPTDSNPYLKTIHAILNEELRKNAKKMSDSYGTM